MEKLKALQRLEESLAKLPSVGKRSAERMAFAMLNMEDDDLEEFAAAVKDLKQSIHFCHNLLLNILYQYIQIR